MFVSLNSRVGSTVVIAFAVWSSLVIACARPSDRDPNPRTPVRTTTVSAQKTNKSVKGIVTLAGSPVQYFGVITARNFASSFPPAPQIFYTPSGAFALTNLEPVETDIVIIGHGFARKIISGVKISPAAVIDLGEIRVDPGFTVEGTVVDEAGRTVSNASVDIIQSKIVSSDPLHNLAVGNYNAITDSSGYFKISGVSSVDLTNPIWRTSAAIPGQGASLPELLRSGNHSIRLVIKPTGVIRGSIEHLADGMIYLKPIQVPKSSLMAPVVSGSYSIEVPVGEYVLTVFGASSRYAATKVIVTAGSDNVADFALRP